MLSIAMNDAAADLLGLPAGRTDLTPDGSLAPALRERLSVGIVRRGDTLVWAGPSRRPDPGPPGADDLTGWECAHNSFHLEDAVPVAVAVVDDAPVVEEQDQRTLLLQGLAFALEFAALVRGLDTPCPVRCIVGANATNATFRFHRIRAGEAWHHPDLDRYRLDKIVVVDIEPGTRPTEG